MDAPMLYDSKDRCDNIVTNSLMVTGKLTFLTLNPKVTVVGLILLKFLLEVESK